MSHPRDVAWKLTGSSTMQLAEGVDWGDPMVRVEVRLDARTLSASLKRRIVIANPRGEAIESVEVPR